MIEEGLCPVVRESVLPVPKEGSGDILVADNINNEGDRNVAASRAADRRAFLLIEFKGHRRGWFPNPGLIPFYPSQIAIVEADRGEDAGVVRAGLVHEPCSVVPQAFNVVRAAGDDDVQRIERHRAWEVEALAVCQAKIKTHRLPMSLVDSEYRFDELKLTFYFTSDGRVDFRELVRDLAAAFRTRIELRQIGARDEIKRGDGFGICGRRLCCVSFMDVFLPITTGMAKSQRLILNPTKLSGRCGRLKCCLAFEIANYGEDEGGPAGLSLVALESEGRLEQLSD